ncbi:hypothetical protein DCS_00751 [Drechmeria coniospora]|uniref:Uncharacterized protein n=1 Tax=Drechmeria coniospora TaxID=98403 RepID=A0A151GRC7_DRECN|nr:hypothetical protein DCS_00751 [Drechmeria coniospora]KYK59618.1 hypothetical protein DCS_00751 [Drechmeria coniospora]
MLGRWDLSNTGKVHCFRLKFTARELLVCNSEIRKHRAERRSLVDADADANLTHAKAQSGNTTVMETERKPTTTSPGISTDMPPPSGQIESAASCLDRVNDRDVISSYNGDIQDALIDLIDLIQTSDSTTAAEGKRGELVQTVVRFVELGAAVNDSENSMRETLRGIRTTFEEYTTERVDERGSPYQKLINLYSVRRKQKERRRRRKSRTRS